MVINADSMQVYPTLCTLTARPFETDPMQGVVHHLYGHVPASRLTKIQQASGSPFSRLKIDGAAGGAQPEGNISVFVGGTGLYFKALTGGLSDMSGCARRHLPTQCGTVTLRKKGA